MEYGTNCGSVWHQRVARLMHPSAQFCGGCVTKAGWGLNPKPKVYQGGGQRWFHGTQPSIEDLTPLVDHPTKHILMELFHDGQNRVHLQRKSNLLEDWKDVTFLSANTMERRLHRLRSIQTRSAWASSCGPWIVNGGWPRVGTRARANVLPIITKARRSPSAKYRRRSIPNKDQRKPAAYSRLTPWRAETFCPRHGG